MLIQELFQRATVNRGPVTQGIATVLAPAILREFAAIPALGGSGKPFAVEEPDIQALLDAIPAYTPEELQAFSAKGFDQSLSTHLINGLFAGMYLAERLPEWKMLAFEEQRVWALGYTVHDYTKAYSRKVSAGQLDVARQLVSKLGERLEFDRFMNDWRAYLDDIVFVAQNTQTVQGANLNLRDYSLRLDKRQRETMRMLSSVTDLLVHITSPSDVLYRDVRGRDLAYNLRQKVEMLFGAESAPHLTYHKLLEVRGLLSNLVNNAMIDVLGEHGYEPFLFFPEGVIYLAPHDTQARIEVEQVTEAAWKHITSLLTGGNQRPVEQEEEDSEEAENDEEGQGLRMQRTKDYMRVPEILYELLSLDALLEMGRQKAMSIGNSKTAARLGAEQAEERGLDGRKLSSKEKDARYQVLGSEWAKEQNLPIDVRADQLAEYLVLLRYRIFPTLFPKLANVTAMLLEALGLANEITPQRAERQRGGTPTGWFYVAARYLQAHPGLDPAGLVAVMKHVEARARQFIEEHGLIPSRESKMAPIFHEYATHIIEVDGRLVGKSKESMYEQFAHELQRYLQSKEERKIICSLCASPYAAGEQEAGTILFKPQQYSNKAPLDTTQLKRGICPICSLEMMLRMVQQDLPGRNTQEKKAINLYLYPTYFFTTETAQVVRLFVNRLQNLNLHRLIYSHLEKQGFSYRNLINYQDFIIDDDAPPAIMKGRRKQQYSEEDQAALFFITLYPSVKKPTDTDAWILPAFYALALPLLLGVKCVATPSFAALYSSASDFQETARIDGGHQFIRYLLQREYFRVDEIPADVERLLRVYSLHLDVYGGNSEAHRGELTGVAKVDPDHRPGRNDRDAHWGQLTGVAKDLATDPLYVFQYYDRHQRRPEEDKKKRKGGKPEAASQKYQGISPLDQQRYIGVYFALGRRSAPPGLRRAQ